MSTQDILARLPEHVRARAEQEAREASERAAEGSFEPDTVARRVYEAVLDARAAFWVQWLAARDAKMQTAATEVARQVANGDVVAVDTRHGDVHIPLEGVCTCPATSEYDPPCARHGVLGIGVTGSEPVPCDFGPPTWTITDDKGLALVLDAVDRYLADRPHEQTMQAVAVLTARLPLGTYPADVPAADRMAAIAALVKTLPGRVIDIKFHGADAYEMFARLPGAHTDRYEFKECDQPYRIDVALVSVGGLQFGAQFSSTIEDPRPPAEDDEPNDSDDADGE